MTIYNKIKNTGIDLFISYHPKVIQLKREAKTLHKEYKDNGLSLMQCQELVAKQNGFQNWYNFINLIKKHYQESLDNTPFLITSDINAPKFKVEKNYNIYVDKSDNTYLKSEYDKPILFGYDINLSHYKWQNDYSMKTHQLILGSSVYKSFDVFISTQAIKNDRSVIFFNGEGDEQTLHSLIQAATLKNRESDIKIINFTKNSLYHKYEHKIKNSFSGNALKEILYQILDFNEEYLKNKALSFISLVVMYLEYKKNNENINITLHSLKEYLNLEKIKKIETEKLPVYIKDIIESYIEKMNNSNIDELKQYQIISNYLVEKVDKLIATNMFNDDEFSIDLKSMLDKGKKIIWIIQMPLYDKVSQVILSFLKTNVVESLGVSLEMNINIFSEILSKKRKLNNEVLYVFIRSCYTPKGIAVMPSQSRSLGLSLNFSYANAIEFEKFNDQENIQSIIYNTNTKIFSPIKDDQTMLLLNIAKSEELQNSILTKNNKKNQQKQNYVWLVKGIHFSQISFDITF